MTNLQSPDTWKIQLTIAINFIFSKDSEKEREMCSTSDNIKFTFYSDVNKVVKEIFESPSYKIPEQFRSIDETK